jgi:hypothetical protein
MSQGNVEVVRIAYGDYEKRSVDRAADFLAPGFRFHTRPEFPDFPPVAVEGLPALWANLDQTFTEYRLVPEAFTSIGEYVLVKIRTSSRMKDSEARVEATIYHLWQFRAGKALEAWSFSTEEEALHAAGLSE